VDRGRALAFPLPPHTVPRRPAPDQRILVWPRDLRYSLRDVTLFIYAIWRGRAGRSHRRRIPGTRDDRPAWFSRSGGHLCFACSTAGTPHLLSSTTPSRPLLTLHGCHLARPPTTQTLFLSSVFLYTKKKKKLVSQKYEFAVVEFHLLMCEESISRYIKHDHRMRSRKNRIERMTNKEGNWLDLLAA
jgi:hypothetical protein